MVEVDLTNRAPVGAHLRLQAARQLDLRQSFQHLLPVPIIAGLIVENKHYAGQSKDGHGSQVLEMRDSVHLDFNGDRYLLLDLFCGVAGPLCNDLNVVVRHVRVGFDRQVVKRDRSPYQEKHGNHDHNEPVVERVIDECANHRVARALRIYVFTYCSTVLCRTSALETTCWPGCTPETI